MHAVPGAAALVAAQNQTPLPIGLGLLAFGTLMLALLIVTRWNKDR